MLRKEFPLNTGTLDSQYFLFRFNAYVNVDSVENDLRSIPHSVYSRYATPPVRLTGSVTLTTLPQSLLVYPNPANSCLMIQNTCDQKVRVYDVRGNVVYSGQGHCGSTDVINVTALPNGAYVLYSSQHKVLFVVIH